MIRRDDRAIEEVAARAMLPAALMLGGLLLISP